MCKTWAWPAWVSNNASFPRGSSKCDGWLVGDTITGCTWLAGTEGDVIAGCTHLIDWPCCPVAGDDGCEATSRTAATASCSSLPSLLFFSFSHSFDFLFPNSIPILSPFFFNHSLFSSSPPLFLRLASPGLMLSAGAAALLSV